jgi:hypothetical protein
LFFYFAGLVTLLSISSAYRQMLPETVAGLSPSVTDAAYTRLELSLEALPTFLGPVSAFQENVAHRLASVAALALVSVGFNDGIEIGA